MHRLSGEDAGFLALELPIQPMNTMGLVVLRPGTGADGIPRPLELDDLRRHMAQRLDVLPVFRRRVQRVPLGLSHPIFIEDPDFDLDFHLREHTLPAPGGADQIDQFYARLAELPLDRRHPLWQLTLVHGLEGGHQAVVLRIHHCLMDGFATITTFSCIFSDQVFEPPSPTALWHPEQVPRPSRLVLDAVRHQARAARQLPALIGKTRGNLSAVKAQRAASTALPPAGDDVPTSVINRGFTADRRLARATLAVADLQLVKNVAGTTLNDVALAVVSGALRRYLEARGSLPARPLVSIVPVGMEAPGAAPRTSGNRFSALTTSLATDISDPWERLETIRAVTAEAKRLLALSGPELLPDWLEQLPPALLDRAIRRRHRKRGQHPEILDANVVVSNVRGPQAPRFLGSARVEEMYITGPPNNGAGVNVTLLDYGDRIFIGILSFADSVAAPGELADGLRASLAELLEIATARAAVHQAGPTPV
jgi:diacylglycerol O-acyltransferase / wax synthase